MPTAALLPQHSQQLFFGASWALAHGDAGGLAQVVEELAQRFTGELRDELLALSQQCHSDYDLAAERWPALCARAHAVLVSAPAPSPAAKPTPEAPKRSGRRIRVF